MFRDFRLDKYSPLFDFVFGVSEALIATFNPIFSENWNPLETGVLTDAKGVDLEMSDDTPKENPEVFFSSSTGSAPCTPNEKPALLLGSSLDSAVVDPNLNPELLSVDSLVTPNKKPPDGFASFEDWDDDPNLNPPVGFSVASTGFVDPKLKPLFEALVSAFFDELSPDPNLKPPDDPNWNV